MTTKVSSRLVKKETNKLLRRTLIMAAVAVVLILAFIFIVLPNFIKLVVWFSGDTEATSTETEYQFIQVPTIQSPPTSTNQPSIDITGYGSAGAEVVLVVNGSESTRKTANEDGSFSIPLNLIDGENAISVYQILSNKAESDTSDVFTVLFDKQAPTLELEAPSENQEVSGKENQMFVVKGKVNEDAEIYVNDRLTFINEEKMFNYTLQLQEGDNTITVKSVDDAGNTTEVSRVVKYRK